MTLKTSYHSSKNLFFGTHLNLWVKRTKTQAFFLWYFNVDNQFIVVFSLDIDRFQLYLLSESNRKLS